MIKVRKTIKIAGKPDDVQVYSLRELSSKTGGPFVSNKVIYDLRKRGKSVVKSNLDTEIIFEVVS